MPAVYRFRDYLCSIKCSKGPKWRRSSFLSRTKGKCNDMSVRPGRGTKLWGLRVSRLLRICSTLCACLSPESARR